MKRPPALSLVAAVVCAALSIASSACGSKPSAGDCDKMVRHIVDLEAAEAGAGAVAADQKADLEQRKKSVFQSVGTTYCRDEMPVDQVRCALDAKTLADLSDKCDKS